VQGEGDVVDRVDVGDHARHQRARADREEDAQVLDLEPLARFDLVAAELAVALGPGLDLPIQVRGDPGVLLFAGPLGLFPGPGQPLAEDDTVV